jgi:hypothetical protein
MLLIPKFKEAKEMSANDDGFFTDDSFLNRKGKTQCWTNPQGQEIKAKITYKEVEEMFANDDGFFTDDWFLNRKGKTQSANPQGQEIKAKITSPVINATSSRWKVIKQSDKRHGPTTQAKTPAPITNGNIPQRKAKPQMKKGSHMSK